MNDDKGLTPDERIDILLQDPRVKELMGYDEECREVEDTFWSIIIWATLLFVAGTFVFALFE